MSIAIKAPACDHAIDLRQAMRHLAGGVGIIVDKMLELAWGPALAGGVGIITAGIGQDRTGLTATSVTAFSMEPPTMLFCLNRSASAWAVIRKHGHFAVNIPSAGQQHVAERFAGRGGVKGAAHYEGANWRELPSGASGLEGALAVVDCTVDEIIERHSHAIVIGGVVSVTLGSGLSSDPLVYGYGVFAPVRLPVAGDGA